MPRKLTNWLDTYLLYTANHESPEVFHWWTAVTCLGAATRANVWMDRCRYTLFPNLYVMLVSDSAFLRRSVCQKICVNNFFRKLPDVKVFSDTLTAPGIIDSIGRTCILPDGTKREEATALIWAPELALMLGSKDVHTRKAALFLVDVFEGKREHQDTTRAGGGVKKIYNLVISFLASTAPDWLDNLPEEMIGGGFTGRIIFVTAEKRKRPIAWPELSGIEQQLEADLLHDLCLIGNMQGEMKPTLECHQRFQEWYENELPLIKLPFGDMRTKPFYERIHDHALKIAMILSMSEGDSYVVEKRHLDTAIKECYKIFTVIPKAIKAVGSTDIGRITERVFTHIERGGVFGVRHSDLLRSNSYQLKSEDFKAIIQSLIDQDRIEIKSGSGTKTSPLRYVMRPPTPVPGGVTP